MAKQKYTKSDILDMSLEAGWNVYEEEIMEAMDLDKRRFALMRKACETEDVEEAQEYLGEEFNTLTKAADAKWRMISRSIGTGLDELYDTELQKLEKRIEAEVAAEEEAAEEAAEEDEAEADAEEEEDEEAEADAEEEDEDE